MTNRPPTSRFNKSERLRHKSLIDPLFTEGERLSAFPLLMVWRKLDDSRLKDSFRYDTPDRIGPLQVMITVPKRRLRHAVDRVYTRRRIRESYRLLRMPLKEAVDANPDIRSLQMAFIYLDSKPGETSKIKPKMQKLLSQLLHKLHNEEKIE